MENSAKYILGPQALLAEKAPLTPEQVDFSHDPEILIQDYSSKNGPLTLTLIQYPTPQIAGERLRALQSAEQSSPNSLLVRRSGPLVDVVTGAVGSSEAHALTQLSKLRSRGHVGRSNFVQQARQHRQPNVRSVRADRNHSLDLTHLRNFFRGHSRLDEASFSGSSLRSPRRCRDHSATSSIKTHCL